jgi:transposase InsO family protein
MKTICSAIGVARSSVAQRRKASGKQPRKQYHKAADQELLPAIREIVDQRPTYGYRRIHVLLNRLRYQQGLSPVNHKRVYRIMKINNLLLQRYTGKPHGRAHTGTIITLKSNLRWCSDVFEIPCWNKEVVRVIFSLDCCDREVLSYVATTGWISAETVRDLMVQSLEYRFGHTDQAPHTIEWLSDNGSYYLARDTIAFAHSINLKVCSTPTYSPQSNGMAEAFVKTFKRDYVFVHDRPDPRTVLAQLHRWFEDYNNHHPHKGLRMCSPREFIRNNERKKCTLPSVKTCPVL